MSNPEGASGLHWPISPAGGLGPLSEHLQSGGTNGQAIPHLSGAPVWFGSLGTWSPGEQQPVVASMVVGWSLKWPLIAFLRCLGVHGYVSLQGGLPIYSIPQAKIIMHSHLFLALPG